MSYEEEVGIGIEPRGSFFMGVINQEDRAATKEKGLILE